MINGFLARTAELHAGGLSGSEARRRLSEELAAGRLSVPAGSLEISASGPLDANGDPPASLDAWFLLYFPHANSATLGVTDEDPGDGQPWLHHAGTAEAPIMWRMRVGDQPR